MTDNQIIKALGCCPDTNHCELCECKEHCPNDFEELMKLALDLINRQKAEIEELSAQFRDLDIECERLEKENESLNTEVALLHTDYTYKFVKAKAKAEAYKEFAEELIHKITNTPTTFPSTYFPYRDGIKYREAEIIAMIKELAGDKK